MRWLNVVSGGVSPHRDAATGPERMQRNVERFATAWLALVVIADLTVRHVVLIVLVSISTLLVSAVSTVRRTVIFAAVGAVLAALAMLWNEGHPTPTATVRVVNTTLLGAIAVGLATLRTRRERQLLRIVAAAEAAQRAVLPTLPSRVGPVVVAARYHSAADEAMVGGDVFDMYYNEEGKVVALVGDVAGHGLGSVEEGARLIRAFRQYAPTSETLEKLAVLMDAYITPFLGPEVFVTAVLADVSSAREVAVVSCGHPAPLLLTSTGITELPIVHGPPLGLGASPEAVTYPWGTGDRLLLHTDGLLEARDTSGRFLTADRLAPALGRPTPNEALDATVAMLESYVRPGALRDDVCLMILENSGPSQ